MAMWWHKKQQPYCFRGFHIQEILDVALVFKLFLVPIEPYPVSNDRVVVLGSERFQKYMGIYPGIVIGQTHAVAWDTALYHDPKDGSTKTNIDFEIRELWAAVNLLPHIVHS